MEINISINKTTDGLLDLFISEEGSSGCSYTCVPSRVGEIFQYYMDTQSSLNMESLENDDSLESLGLSVKAFNTLKRAGIHTIPELLSRFRDKNDFLVAIGKEKAEEIEAKLHNNNFWLPWEIVNATFVSRWDGGWTSMVSTPCKVNLCTKEVFDIEMVDTEDLDLGFCEREEIVIEKKGCSEYCGTKIIKTETTSYPVFRKDEVSEGDFWYE